MSRLQSVILQSGEDLLVPLFIHSATKCHENPRLYMKLTMNFESVHDPDFRQSEKDFYSFTTKLTERLVEIDDTVPELPVKDIVSSSLHAILQDIRTADETAQIFRIYRDVRFSKDPTPYKVRICPLLASRPAACPSPPRLARPTPAACRQDAP